ncbi:Guanine-nucleotide dissociation stimulator CDC25 [Penicillium capsulatum]|uniref:Guanine-nucleotide dissociation stimulator CDC25 n=1 Tax=Penicillium capsulatum TaxID=69766 RepID=A0A9W9I041_9EURO|nr:Guanine-nucleotide dissociation stimulator CDC25 [Penicillium capsulatum]KAJ6117405.1 Guanine-nucleotide dissociation stimulator CDC25 [Penicillium capsulatum]
MQSFEESWIDPSFKSFFAWSTPVSPRTSPGMSPTVPSVASDATQSYRSLFQSTSEIPRFVVTYRWWEDEATTVLWAFNIPDMKQVIRYGLFRDENFPRNSLLSRNADTIDTFLVALSDPREHQLLGNLSHLQRVEEILRRSSIPPFQPVPWSWFPSPGYSSDAQAIAATIDTESHFHFTRIAFEEIVRASLGYKAVSVEWFLLQHTALYVHLLGHLHAYPEEVPLYVEVEEHLRTLSPFAHRALVQALLAAQPDAAQNIPHSNKPGFEFIAGPIQSLWKDQMPSLTTILKMFNVLAIRFRRQYIHTSKMDWKQPFDTTIVFLEDCLNSTSPVDLACTLTNVDEVDYTDLTRESLVAEDAVVQRILANWRILSTSVWECCSALPDLTPYLRECAQTLYTTRNYHSLTAVLDGLHRYAISTARTRGLNNTVGEMVVLDPILPLDPVILTSPDNNYAAYRQQYQEYPGIPFLLPHLREQQQHGEASLQSLLQHLQATPIKP